MAASPSNALIADTLALITADTPHLALYTTNPTAADTGTEVSGGSYARQAISFGTVTGGAVSNITALTFAGMPGATITHWGIKDAATAGNLKAFGDFTTPLVMQAGDDITIPVGDLDVSFSGS